MHVEVSRQADIGKSAPLRQMLIIGGTGDLSRRHLLPALTRLLANGELHGEFSLTLTGLEPMSGESCRAFLGRELSVHAAHLAAGARDALVERTSYLRADVRDESALATLAVTDPVLVYLATPSEAVPAGLRALAGAGIHRAPGRLVFDKPFGLSERSARALNEEVLALTDERNVYRVDHFLYHHAVQALIRARLQPDVFSLFHRLPVRRVEIVWDETRESPPAIPAGGGVVRDMIQSHLLQLAAVLTMKPPGSLTRDDLAGNRLAALRRISALGDTEGPPAREPETSASLVLQSEMPGWEHVPFVLRAAKGAEESRRHIELRFADGFMRLEVLAGNLVVGRGTSAVEFGIGVDPESASTRLLRAALGGDDTFTLRPEEPEEAWRIVDPVLESRAEPGGV